MSQTVVIGRAAESFVIEGGRPLYGRIQAAGNKNGALPILAACLLTTEPVVLRNVPRIVDVETMIELLNDVGAEAEWTGPNEVRVRAAEIAIMAASLTPGETVIGNAACEPHVQDLCRFLVSLGAEIAGIESNVLRIQGVEKLGGGEWEIGPDHIEVGSFIGLAAITGGDVTVDGVKRADLVSLLHGFEKLGVQVELGDDYVRVPPRQELVIQDDL